MQVEFVLLILSLLFFVSIITDKIGFKFGVPALLLFLAVGMLFGPEGVFTWFGDKDVIGYVIGIGPAQAIGTIALCVILFSGGMDTKINDVRLVAGPGVTLATIGVLLTCIVTGILIYFIFKWSSTVETVSIWIALLMAATMSSTDSASVFSILRTNGIKLKHNIRPLLELESGANDPMAYILTTTLIGIVMTWNTELTLLGIVQDILIQLVMGGVMGFAFGKVVVELLKRSKLNNESLYPIMVLTACIFIFAATYYLQGNPYLAVYIGGLIIGNSRFTKKRQTKSFFDGLTWLSQLVMFLMLGLMVKPSELILLKVWLPCLIISIIMIFISRPLSVFVCLHPWSDVYTQRDKVLVSWVGLKGAVPIIFAILCEASGVPSSGLIFNVVFLCTIVSLIVQGTSLSAIANKLKLATPQEKEKKLVYFDIDLPEEIEASAHESEVTAKMMTNGNQLKDLPVPAHTLIIMARRGENFFVPTGSTELQVGDKLLVISDGNAKQVVQEMEEEEEQILTHWWLQMTHDTKNFVHDKLDKIVETQKNLNAQRHAKKNKQ
ncbi:MAG: potassium/proton antiporter [Paludibacteraceae bacterium]|nr:potassium/proton antiporter [Paludibacteraceae bacterium]